MTDIATANEVNRDALRQNLQLFFVVDCSGSMHGEKIASLNYAMRSAVPALRAAADSHANVDVRVRVISFGEEARWQSEAPIPVMQFDWHNLAPTGETNLGAALTKLADSLTPAAMPGEHLSPVIVLVSDGLPTDDVDGGIARLAASHYGSKAIRIAIAIGSDADLPTLQNFIGAPNVRPLRANNAEALVNSIRWAASAPLKAASMEGAGTPVSEHLAEGISSQNNTSGDLVW